EQPTDETFENEMDESVESLMMEGMRLLDEMLNLGPDVPEMQNVLRPKRPLIAPLRGLTPELLDSFQLVLNYESVSRILNKSLVSDLDTMQDLVHLIRNDYVSVD
ncbi:MAG: hypothetical protein ACNA8W_19720, partial [Bradymonadaceae bacterium]